MQEKKKQSTQRHQAEYITPALIVVRLTPNIARKTAYAVATKPRTSGFHRGLGYSTNNQSLRSRETVWKGGKRDRDNHANQPVRGLTTAGKQTFNELRTNLGH